jgi:hypothetical protein
MNVILTDHLPDLDQPGQCRVDQPGRMDLAGQSCTGEPPDLDAGGTITVLRALHGRRLAKRFYLATNGSVGKVSYDRATYFAAEQVAAGSLRDVYELLHTLESAPAACVIRGVPAASCDRARTRRRKAGANAPFAEVPRRWIMLDLDGIALPPLTSVLDDPADAAATLLDIITTAAPDLADTSCVVQFSSSSALDELVAAEAAFDLPPCWHGVAKRGVAAHVWFYLAEPVGEADLGRWMTQVAAAGLMIDPSTNRTVQPHYTAAPIFESPLRDPLAGRRLAFIERDRDAATLNIPAVARQDGFRHAFARAGRRRYGSHWPRVSRPLGRHWRHHGLP